MLIPLSDVYEFEFLRILESINWEKKYPIHTANNWAIHNFMIILSTRADMNLFAIGLSLRMRSTFYKLDGSVHKITKNKITKILVIFITNEMALLTRSESSIVRPFCSILTENGSRKGLCCLNYLYNMFSKVYWRKQRSSPIRYTLVLNKFSWSKGCDLK